MTSAMEIRVKQWQSSFINWVAFCMQTLATALKVYSAMYRSITRLQ